MCSKYDIVFLFDVKNGNPNGDPSNGNVPRHDPDSMHGLVSGEAIKRAIRDYLADEHDENLLVQAGTNINTQILKAGFEDNEYAEPKLDKGKPKAKKGKDREMVAQAIENITKEYVDARFFGAVLSTMEAGQIRGPVQVAVAESVDPITTEEMQITRVAKTDNYKGAKNLKDYQEKDSDRNESEMRTMGVKHFVPYGLYRSHIHVNAYDAERVGFDDSDMEKLLDSLDHMYELRNTANSGERSTVGIYVFKHEAKRGNAKARDLFKLVRVERKDDSAPARSFDDYEVTVDEDRLPEGIELIKVYEAS